MAGKDREIMIGMGLDTTSLGAGLAIAEKKLAAFQAKTESSGKGAAGGGAGSGGSGVGGALSSALGMVGMEGAVGLASIAGVVGLLKQATDAAGGVKRATVEMGIAFGSSSDLIKGQAEQLVTSYGTDKAAAMEAASSMGFLLQSVGMGQQQTAQLSASFLDMAAKIAVVRGMDMPEVMNAIQMGAAGSTRGLRALGVVINDDKVLIEAYRMGLKKVGEELTENEKTTARVAIIQRDLGKQTAGADAMMQGAGGQQKLFWGQLGEGMEQVGEQIKPVQQAFWSFANEILMDLLIPDMHIVGQTLTWLTQEFYDVRGGIMDVIGTIGGLFGGSAFKDSMKDAAAADWAKAWPEHAEGIGKVGEAAKEAQNPVEALTAKMLKLGEKVGETSKKWMEEAATYGMTGRQAELVKLKIAGATDAQLMQAAAIAGTLDGFDKLKEHMGGLESGAKSLIESTQTPMEKLADEKQKIGEMMGSGLIDKTTAARGTLAAEKASGLGKVEYSGAMAYGSQEARSTLLRAQGQADAGSDPLQEIAKQSRDTLTVQQQQAAAIERINAMMRQFLGTAMPTTGKI